jgi:C_GCAxxG_C_C family probable redox protein
VGQKRLGINDQNLIRAMAPMGGGIASSGGPCGALTGAIALIGSVMGRGSPENSDDRKMWKASYEFYKRFETEVVGSWGSVNCRDITGIDWRDRKQARAFYKDGGRDKCADNTAKAARILGEVMEKYLK